MDIIMYLLEILKYTIPALIVYFTVKVLLTKYLNHQYALQSMQYKQSKMDMATPLKLQAYERLSVLCSRSMIENLGYRLSSSGMNAQSLANAMLIAIQQEFDHNLSQQLYVSEQLWSILKLAKEQTQSIVTEALDQVGNDVPASALIAKCRSIEADMGGNPMLTAQKAIKQEVNILF